MAHTLHTPGKDYTLSDSTTTVGRKAGDICFPNDSMMSGQHFRIDIKSGRAFIVDLGSKNGTLLNNVPLRPNEPRMLAPDDIILAGNTSFTFDRTSEAESASKITIGVKPIVRQR